MRYGELNRDAMYISQRDVRLTLNAMINPALAAAPNSLGTLVQVEQILNDPDLPRIHQREFAIDELMIQIIMEEFSAQRRARGLSPPSTRRDEDYKIHIGADAQTGSRELLCWSLLYYCHVCVEQNIPLETFSQLVGLTPRSLRRYREYAIKRLTEKLIRAEWEARARQRKRRVLAQLPAADHSTPLYGRAESLMTARRIISANPAATILVTGPEGIGKTVFVQEVLRGYIDEGHIDHLVWIENPGTMDQVSQQLHNVLSLRNGQIGLREWMAVYHLAVVINDAQVILRHPVEFDELLQFLAPALVFLTSDWHTPLSRIDAHIQLSELDATAADQLISATFQAKHNERASVEMMEIVRRIAGGNPLAILLTIHNLVVGDTHPDADVLDRLLSQAYSRLNPAEKHAWFGLALCPPGEVDEADLVKLWPELVSPENFVSLIHQHLLEVTSRQPQKYRLFPVAHSYIVSLYNRSADCLALINDLVMGIQAHALDCPHFALEVVGHLSKLDWLPIDEGVKRHWLSILLQSEIDLCRHPAGCALLANTLSDRVSGIDGEIQILHGIALRQFGRWPEASRLFEQIIIQAGKIGHFALQARAQVELAIVQRYCGSYETAIANLAQAREIALRQRDDSLLDIIGLERVQLAVDARDARSALAYLADVPESRRESGRYLMLLGEACLLAQDLERCREATRRAWEKPPTDHLLFGKLYDLTGRTHWAGGEYTEAQECFAVAITCFSAAEDPFALARCLSNLGAVLLSLGLYSEAGDQLARAQHIQSKLGDKIGLAVTERNLEICRSNRLKLAAER